MSNHFSFRRFVLLVKKQGLESLKLYTLCAVALAFILSFVFIFYGWTSNNNFSEEAVYTTYIFGLLIAGALFGSFSFNMLSSKDKSIYYLSFPASRFEKLGVVLFYNWIVFTISYTLIFYVIKTIFWQYVKALAADKPNLYHLTYIDLDKPYGFMAVFPYFICAFFAVQAFYVMGSIYFNRFAFIKTTIAGSIIIFLFVWLISELTSGGLYFDPRGIVTIPENNGMVRSYALPSLVTGPLTYAIKYMWAPVFFVVTYFRLKEKQV